MLHSWETIIAAAKYDNTDKYHVGDTKTINMGSLGTHTIRIANKTKVSECYNTSFSETACGFVLEFVDIVTIHRMNPTSTNTGSWPATELRTYLNEDLISTLPADLRYGIIKTRVISGHGNTDGTSNYTSTDKIYLAHSNELLGYTNPSDTLTMSETRQLDYYASLDPLTIIKYQNSTATGFWTRSPSSNDNTAFGFINASGSIATSDATNAEALAPLFRIG